MEPVPRILLQASHDCVREILRNRGVDVANGPRRLLDVLLENLSGILTAERGAPQQHAITEGAKRIDVRSMVNFRKSLRLLG